MQNTTKSMWGDSWLRRVCNTDLETHHRRRSAGFVQIEKNGRYKEKSDKFFVFDSQKHKIRNIFFFKGTKIKNEKK